MKNLTARPVLACVAGAVGLTSITACNPIDEKVCAAHSYPVTDASGGSGSTCVRSGEPVPPGYTTYAPGHTPTTP